MTISNSRGTHMSYTTEHERMKPVLDLARKLDIATNPAPEAVFFTAALF